MKKIILDVETNGLFDCSVLSFSALVLDDLNNVVNVIDRYYYRDENEQENEQALSINGLYDDVIKEKRINVKYPKYFKDDLEIINIVKDMDLIICHNVAFDVTHLEKAFNIDLSNIKKFCTMRETQYLYNATIFKNGEPKFPKLSESLEYCGVNANDIKNKLGLDFHNSLFDVYCTLEIYKYLQKN